jgi:hypothetical protein
VSKGPCVRLGLRTLVSLVLFAAMAAAATAHVAIDIVGDYALAHDTYDDVAHSSRELISGLALLIALALATRALRVCFELAAANRTRLPQPSANRREAFGFVFGVIAVSATLVPAMEWLDGRLAGVPVKELDDAFGGSILLGLGTTVVCAIVVASIVYAIARWLISHRDAIATILGTLLRRSGEDRSFSRDLARHIFAPRRRRTPHALRLCKRGPPDGASHRHYRISFTEGDPREIRLFARVASVGNARNRAILCRAGRRGADRGCRPR